MFRVAPPLELKNVQALFQYKGFRMLLAKGKVTQEMIAHMLGVRREGVTEAAGRLERAGLIDHKRGRIVVLDRVRLEAHACECYSVIKQAYDQLPRGDGPPGTSGVHGPRPLYVSGRGERAHFGVT